VPLVVWYPSQAPEDGCINNRNMLSTEENNNKTSGIKLVSLYSSNKMFLSFYVLRGHSEIARFQYRMYLLIFIAFILCTAC